MLELLVYLLCAGILASGLLAVRSRASWPLSVSAGLASLFAAVCYLLLGAPDVAMTEASIGSGLSTHHLPLRHPQNQEREGVMAELIGSIVILIGACFCSLPGSACSACRTPSPASRRAPRRPRSATRWCWWGSPSTTPTGA